MNALLEIEALAKQPRKREEKPPLAAKFEHVNFQAPIGWMDEVDEAARAIGLSRSAYIRMSVARQIEADRKARGQ